MLLELRAACKVVGTFKRRHVSFRHDSFRCCLTDSRNLAHPKPHSRSVGQLLECAVEVAVHHVNGANSHTMTLRVLNELAGGVEAKRCRVEHRCEELTRVMALRERPVIPPCLTAIAA